MKETVHLSELLGNRSNCTKQHIKQLWLILLMNCYTNVNMLIFLTSSTGQVRIILIAHLYILLF